MTDDEFMRLLSDALGIPDLIATDHGRRSALRHRLFEYTKDSEPDFPDRLRHPYADGIDAVGPCIVAAAENYRNGALDSAIAGIATSSEWLQNLTLPPREYAITKDQASLTRTACTLVVEFARANPDYLAHRVQVSQD